MTSSQFAPLSWSRLTIAKEESATAVPELSRVWSLPTEERSDPLIPCALRALHDHGAASSAETISVTRPDEVHTGATKSRFPRIFVVSLGSIGVILWRRH